MSKPIQFSQNEQNALAIIAEMMARTSRSYRMSQAMPEYRNGGEEPNVDLIADAVCRVIDSFPSINWGDIYDRFHHQGANF